MVIGWKESLEGAQLKGQFPEEYEIWINSRVEARGTIEEKEKRYQEKYDGIRAEQGFYAFKQGIKNAEASFKIQGPYTKGSIFEGC